MQDFNTPLSKLSSKARSDILKNVVRNALEEITGEKTHDPDPGTTLTGKKRSRNSAQFSFYLEDRKCQVKSAQIRWDDYAKLYTALFCNVKRNEYDDLYLALYTPSGIYMHKHDDKSGLSTAGKIQESNGGVIYVNASCQCKSIDVATNTILEKLQSMFMKHISFDEINLLTS